MQPFFNLYFHELKKSKAQERLRVFCHHAYYTGLNIKGMSSQAFNFDHVLLGVVFSFTQMFSIKNTVVLQVENLIPLHFR